jgi:predicted nucleic acid-binding protein
MTEPSRGLLDTSVVVDHDLIDPNVLPDESAIAAVTLAELAAGPHATDDERERVRRQDRLQWAATTWDPLPFDADARMHTRESLPQRGPPGDPVGLVSRIS